VLKRKQEKKNSNTKSTKETTYSIENNSIYYFKVNGKTFKAGDKISDLEKAGYSLEEKVKNTSIPKNRYLMAQTVVDKDGNEVFEVIPINMTDETILAKDATIGGVEIGSYNTSKVSDATKSLKFEVAGGLKLGQSADDIHKVLGEESFKYESPASTIAGYTTYKYSKGYKGYEFIVDDSGKVSQIHWNNYSYNE
jgi:hypothetical protein